MIINIERIMEAHKLNRDYEKHYRELAEKLGRDKEKDMQKIAQWYMDTKLLDFYSEEHLEIMELFGFERQESSDEFNLEEADYVMEMSVKFDNWFCKRWEFLNEYYAKRQLQDDITANIFEKASIKLNHK